MLCAMSDSAGDEGCAVQLIWIRLRAQSLALNQQREHRRPRWARLAGVHRPPRPILQRRFDPTGEPRLSKHHAEVEVDLATVGRRRGAVQRNPAAITTAARHRDAFMRLRYNGSQCADRLAKSIGSPTTLRGVRNQNVKAVS